MHRIDSTTADQTKHGVGKPGFTGGNPMTATPSTRFTPEWCDDVQENLARLIEAAGIALAKGNHTQLYDAVQALIAAAIGSISIKQRSLIATAQTFAPGVADSDPVRWDAANTRWAKALADGSANDLGLGLADVTNAEVVLYGETRAGLVTGLTPGAAYYLALAGGLTATAAPDLVRVGVAKSAGVLYVDIDAGVPAGIAYLANANVWPQHQSGVMATLVDVGTIAWDVPTRQLAQVTLTASRILGAPTNGVAGTFYQLHAIQGGAGGWALAYNAIYKGVAGVSLTGTAGAEDVLTFYFDGTYYKLVAVKFNVAA